MDPLFWLGLSLFLVCISLTTVLVVLFPAARELGRAARSVEKLCDTLQRELPPTLDAIRRTGLEITELTEDVTEGVQHASRVARQVDHSVSQVQHQAQRAQRTTRSLWAGARAAWHTFTRPTPRDRRRLPRDRPAQLPSGSPPFAPTRPDSQSRSPHAEDEVRSARPRTTAPHPSSEVPVEPPHSDIGSTANGDR